MRVVVTGASRGIGRATALRLGHEGAEVALCFHQHRQEAASAVAEIVASNVSAFALEADLAQPQAVGRLADELARRWPAVDGLVLNAGSYPRRAFEDLTWEEFEDCFRTNLFGSAELTRLLLPLLRKAPSPRVVFVSSILAFDGSKHGAHYAAAKAAVGGLARSLARELAPRVSVNVVAPGSIDTALLAGDTPEVRAQRARSIPLGRVGTAEEVADSIVYLLSSKARYITGATIHVNGGLRME
jgi:3-oxoacyl-[acyl-carrier protein] reductase